MIGFELFTGTRRDKLRRLTQPGIAPDRYSRVACEPNVFDEVEAGLIEDVPRAPVLQRLLNQFHAERELALVMLAGREDESGIVELLQGSGCECVAESPSRYGDLKLIDTQPF